MVRHKTRSQHIKKVWLVAGHRSETQPLGFRRWCKSRIQSILSEILSENCSGIDLPGGCLSNCSTEGVGELIEQGKYDLKHFAANTIRLNGHNTAGWLRWRCFDKTIFPSSNVLCSALSQPSHWYYAFTLWWAIGR